MSIPHPIYLRNEKIEIQLGWEGYNWDLTASPWLQTTFLCFLFREFLVWFSSERGEQSLRWLSANTVLQTRPFSQEMRTPYRHKREISALSICLLWVMSAQLPNRANMWLQCVWVLWFPYQQGKHDFPVWLLLQDWVRIHVTMSSLIDSQSHGSWEVRNHIALKDSDAISLENSWWGTLQKKMLLKSLVTGTRAISFSSSVKGTIPGPRILWDPGQGIDHTMCCQCHLQSHAGGICTWETAAEHLPPA